MEQRIEANTVTYGDVLTAICFPNRKVRKRLLFLIAEYPDSFWLDEHHKARMKRLHDRLGFTKKRNTPDTMPPCICSPQATHFSPEQ